MVINADCIEHMNTMPPDSVDSIVTDPPYHLTSIVKRFGKEGSAPAQFGTDGAYARASRGFMGKEWDGGDIAFRTEVWEAALRVAKPGAYLLAFGGTRTFHRMAVAIEDAGWEIRDTVMWVYGCLSEDTEILTSNGWERFHISTNDGTIMDKEILVYDIQNDVYKWERPKRWTHYSVQQDTAYRIQSDYTDQIVSRGHRCLVERGGKLTFVAADELASLEYMPTLPNDFCRIPEAYEYLLQPEMQRVLSGEGLGNARAQRAGGLDGHEQFKLSGEDERPEQSSVEGWSNLLQAQGQVCRPVNQVCEMPARVHSNGPQGWVCDGASAQSGASNGTGVVALGSGASRQSQRHGQSSREFKPVYIERRPQETRTRTSYRTSLASITPIEYTGLIFCPTVSTGAFVARRNGKIFITGNSGFPKSHNVGKGIDKAAGAEREVLVGATSAPNGKLGGYKGERYKEKRQTPFGVVQDQPDITAPATDAARQWNGWGTALKPAWEPIIVARKPLEGTVAANMLAHGTGAMNIDGCRVGTSESLNGGAYAAAGTERDDGWGMQRGGAGEYQQPTGRWPANLIHDGSDEVVALFPETGKSTGGRIGKKSMGNVTNVPAGQYEKGDPGYGDSGSAARFFYCAKANKDDRNEGLEEFEDRKKVFNGKTALPSPSNDVEGSVNEKFSTHPQKNHHPTVKPTALMRYLCKLVTRAGGIVLDPFCGSGSTGKAAILEGFKFIGIEKDPEYHKIAEARINLQSILQASLPDTSHNELEVGVNTQSDMFK